MRFIIHTILIALSMLITVGNHMIAQVEQTKLSALEALRDELKNSRKDKAKQISAIDDKLDSLKTEIEILSGWLTGFNGLVGFDYAQSHRWASNENPNAATSSLALSLGTFANKIREKGFWRNSALVNLGWQSLDTDTDDADVASTFLSDRTTDVLQVSTLYGFRLNPDLAASILGDLNTSVFNFLDPGSFDFGLGSTWTPSNIPNFVAVINPLTLHYIFSNREDVENTSALGLKLKVTYQKKFDIGLQWSSTLTGFAPYQAADEGQPSLFEYTWINALSFNIWKGIGVGFNFGLRRADFEVSELQWYQTLGLSYAF